MDFWNAEVWSSCCDSHVQPGHATRSALSVLLALVSRLASLPAELKLTKGSLVFLVHVVLESLICMSPDLNMVQKVGQT